MKPLHSIALKHERNSVWILDQTRLPFDEVWLEAKTPEEMIGFIRSLKVRGAPLIGVAAALSLGKFSETNPSRSLFLEVAARVREARPTAVNLMAAVDRIVQNPQEATRVAEEIFEEDVALCDAIARNGAKLFEKETVLTHCNAGALATAGVGTAVGVIAHAFRLGRIESVFVDETRPLLQGGRLTTWELKKMNIPYTLICDNMAGFLMQQGRVTKIIVGADRIALNGDFANKIGTYSLAVLAKYHGIPFYVAAPRTTLSLTCHSMRDIPIEERGASEVRGFVGTSSVVWSPQDSPVYNPAFDVTPAHLVKQFILDTGVYSSEEVAQGVFNLLAATQPSKNLRSSM